MTYVASVLRRRCMIAALVTVSCICHLGGPGTAAAAGQAYWSVRNIAEPSIFSANDALICNGIKCDSYQLLVVNAGNTASIGPITLTDKLPVGLRPEGTPESGRDSTEVEWQCATEETNPESWTVTCTFADAIPVGGYAPFLNVRVSAPAPSASASLENAVSVMGGGALEAATAVEQTTIGAVTPQFGVSEFSIENRLASGGPSLEAGAHPWQETSTFEVPSAFSPPGSPNSYLPIEDLKSVAVDLPTGLIGNPLATPRCSTTQLRAEDCPVGSEIGTFAVLAGDISFGEFAFTGSQGLFPSQGGCCSAVYNMIAQRGYPAEFGFTYADQTVVLYANIVNGPRGYHVRITSAGLPSELETSYVALTLFGEPAAEDGTSGEAAFLTNPAACSPESTGPARLEARTWNDPTAPVFSESTVYPELTECGRLSFAPSVAFGPSSASEGGVEHADAPSAFTFKLSIPQSSGFNQASAAELRRATVSLPEGVVISPPAANNGLVGCPMSGSDGINLGSTNIGKDDRDIGDPEATELGAGHAGGNTSPYDDGYYHTAPGKCPPASVLGTAEVVSPILEEPLYGHLYLAQPGCGGEGQSGCTEVDAADGSLFSVFLEVGGENGDDLSGAHSDESGVIVKLLGRVAADPHSGLLSITFSETPQVPFGSLTMMLHGGASAPLAMPQKCSQTVTTSVLTPWSAPATPKATPSSGAFGVVDCSNSPTFGPGFVAGSTIGTAGAATSFTATLSRHDGEQDFSGASMTLPPGLVGLISHVPRCGEPEAGEGRCSDASRIGSATVAAGAGSAPLALAGRVYFTSRYAGAPFGLSIVVPAKAGPFNLGDVVVRAAIHIDPSTGAVTAVANEVPTIRDGVPFRLKSINVSIDRPGFLQNPTNCEGKAVAVTATGEQGAIASASSPFAVNGCNRLPFKPSLTVSTLAKTSKANGASLTVKISQRPGEANIKAVELTIPSILPTRLTTLQKACTEAQFNANPAKCPEGSIIGTGTALTPVLGAPLVGPAYLVSHGGAAFPDVEFVLQGEGVMIVLDGRTDIKRGITYSRFTTVPDAPVTSFETQLPEGPHSILTTNGNLCAPVATVTAKRRIRRRVHGRVRTVSVNVHKIVSQPLVVPTVITGQNHTRVTQSTKIAVIGCGKTVRQPRRRKKSTKHKTRPVRH
jgi:hypothetical protein